MIKHGTFLGHCIIYSLALYQLYKYKYHYSATDIEKYKYLIDIK